MKKPSWLEILADAPKHFLKVDRKEFTLIHYTRPTRHSAFEPESSYPIALGMIGHETPEKIYTINSKVKYPDWMVPDSEWAINAGLVPGTVYEGGTDANPIKERWLGVTDPSEGIGIHGTAAKDSMGTLASHGCIRMKPHDVIKLFEVVPKGTLIELL